MKRRSIAPLVISAFTLVLVSGCGGGSSGTGAPAVAAQSASLAVLIDADGQIAAGTPWDISNAAVTVNERPVALSALRRGMVVDVEGEAPATPSAPRSAKRVSYLADLIGAIEAITTTETEVLIRVVGRTVRLRAAVSYDGLADSAALNVGDFVEVSGTPAADGSLLAERLTRSPPSATSHYVGRMTSSGQGRQMTIDEMLTVDLNNVPAFNVPAGTRMIVQGEWAASVLRAQRVAVPVSPLVAPGDQVELRGLVERIEAGSVFLAGQPIAIDVASFANVTLPQALETGTLVQVDGELGDAGRLVVRRLTEFRTP